MSERFRVDGYAKACPNQAEISIEEITDTAFKQGFAASIDLLLTSTQQRIGPRQERLMFATRETAEYITGYGVCGCIIPVEKIATDVRITGRVSWSEQSLEQERDLVRQLAGKMID